MTTLSPARTAALDRLARQAARFPDLEFVDAGAPPRADGELLDARDAALARAIEHAAVRRWLTLVAVCSACIDRRWENVDHRIQAALLAGAAQMLLFGQQAPHAVVDDTVEWTKRKGRRGAPGFVNAVLRRIAALRGEIADAQPAPGVPGVPGVPSASGGLAALHAWHDRCDALPLEDGRVMTLTRPLFSADRVARLSQQTSHGEELILHWINTAGRDAALERSAHGLVSPPTVVTGAVPPGEHASPHSQPGFWIWNAPHAQLLEWLRANPAARVQDSASARPVGLARHLQPTLVLDACAGRGTKTRQLAEAFPQAEIVATDTDATRLRALALAFEGHPRVKVTTPDGLRRVIGTCDLLLLDVPCSNTGVLARRPEARYRFNRARLDGLVSLQRAIADEYLPFLAPGGHVLFSTCSLENAENGAQGAWLARRMGGRMVGEEGCQPSGLPGQPSASYSDGSFGALVRR